jgi:hypothetical protein
MLYNSATTKKTLHVNNWVFFSFDGSINVEKRSFLLIDLVKLFYFTLLLVPTPNLKCDTIKIAMNLWSSPKDRSYPKAIHSPGSYGSCQRSLNAAVHVCILTRTL